MLEVLALLFGSAVLGWVVILIAFLLALVVIKIRGRFHQQYYRDRVWYVCRINERIGLTPQDAFDRFVRDYWQNVRQSKPGRWPSMLYGNMIRIPEDEVIVVADGSQAYFTLTCGHYLERREFFVPVDETPMEAAFQRMNGRLWDGKFIEWRRVHRME